MLGAGLTVLSTYVFAFVLFSVVFIHFGVTDFVVSASRRIFARDKNNSALVMAFSSFLFGILTIRSRMNIANVGSLTVDDAKRSGYSEAYIGGILSAVATGSKLAPPLLGVAALYMRTKLAMSYGKL